MRKRGGIFLAFLLFLTLSLLIYFLFRSSASSFVSSAGEFVIMPLQNSLGGIFGGLRGYSSSDIDTLRTENRTLVGMLAKKQASDAEVIALQSQYKTTEVDSTKLKQARIIGMRAFIPGVSLPEAIVLDKGDVDGMKGGQTVVFQNNIVGLITHTTKHRALVTPVYHVGQTLTAKTLNTGALGLATGRGNGFSMLEGVVLSEKLEKGDYVVSRGDENIEGKGYAPDLVIGKISSVNKKASSLFQSAVVESLLDFTKLTTVFVIIDR